MALRSAQFVGGISSALFILTSVSNAAPVKPKSLLIYKKDSVSAFSLHANSTKEEGVERVDFKSEAEKNRYLSRIDSNEYEVEEVQVFKGDDVSLQEQVQAAMARDPLAANSWSMFSVTNPVSFQTPDIDVVRAWNITKGSSHIKVYVMDSGIEKDPNADRPMHPDLRDRVTSYYDAINPGQFPADQNSHGTHVAAIIAAQGDNDVGIKGVVPGEIQLGIGRFLNAQNQGDSGLAYNVASWIEQDMAASRAQDPQMRFVWSNSWGGGYSAALEAKMARVAGTYDVSVITSAGNNSKNVDQNNYYPCVFRIVGRVCVAASDYNDLLTSFSSYGPNSVHLMAPGLQIFSIIPGATSDRGYSASYQRKDGTSQAVPHVAGVAALMRAANPKLSATEVQQILVASVDLLPNGQAAVLSGGRLNAYRAVLLATGQDPNQANRDFATQLASNSGGCSMQNTDTTAPGSALILLLLSAILWIVARGNYRNFSINN